MSRVDWSILFDFLRSQQNAYELTFTFSEIEKIINNKLPESAHVYDSWWRNDRTHSQARAWMNAGWKTVKPNPRDRSITFKREKQ